MKLNKTELVKLVSWIATVLFLIIATVSLSIIHPRSQERAPIVWAIAIPLLLILYGFICFIMRKKAKSIVLILLLIISYITKIMGAIFSLGTATAVDPIVFILHLIVFFLFLATFILHLTFDLINIKKNKIN